MNMFAKNKGKVNDKLQALTDKTEQLSSRANDIRDEVQNEELRARKRRKEEVTSWLDEVREVEEEVDSINSNKHKTPSSDALEGMTGRVEELLKRGEFPLGLVLDDLKPEGTIVEMKPLLEKEAWDLFVNQLGVIQLSDKAKSIAEQVARECGGLPLGIITMARCMRGVSDEHEWETLWRGLQHPSTSQHDMETKVLNILKLSYDRLPGVKLQQCLLCCATMYPQGYIDRNNLIRRFIQLGLIDGSSRQGNIDEGHSLLNALEDASLLECVTVTYIKGQERIAKMHDLVQDMAIRIIGRSGMIKPGKSPGEVPRNTEWNEDLVWVCLQWNRIKYIDDKVQPNCPKLLMLNLQFNWFSFIPDSFFAYMPSLRVLDLSSTDISLVPESVSGLCNLNALLLSNCSKLHYIPSVRNLTKLSELDVKLCVKLQDLPEGTEELVSLKHLDLRGTSIESMCYLCHLQTFLCNYKIAILPEILESLRHLECFKGRLEDLEAYKQCVGFGCFDQWKSYSLHVGYLESESRDESIGHFDERHLTFSSCEISIGIGTFFTVPPNVWSLEFTCCMFGVTSLLDALPSLCGASELERLVLRVCTTIEYIVSDRWLKQRGDAASLPFSKIQQLFIFGLEDFVGLVEGDVVHPYVVFGSLKKLIIYVCQSVKKLNLNLPNLEKIDIAICGQMEEIFATTQGVRFKLQNLRALSLESLNVVLRRMCWNSLSFPTLAVLKIRDFRQVNKLGLLSYNLPSLKIILIENCEEMDEIFGVGDEKGGNAIQFPNLKKMWLKNLPKLWTGFEKGKIELLSLEKIYIHECQTMEKILQVGAYLPHLKYLKLTGLSKERTSVFTTAHFQVHSLEIIVIAQCAELVHIFDMGDEPGQTVIRFPNLKQLYIRYLPALRSVFRKGTVELPSLENMQVKCCKRVVEIFEMGFDTGDHVIDLPNLQYLELTKLPELRSIGRKAVVCKSVRCVELSSAGGKLENCPISIPRLLVNNNQPLPMLHSSGIHTGWWASLQWNDPVTKTSLSELGCLTEEDLEVGSDSDPEWDLKWDSESE